MRYMCSWKHKFTWEMMGIEETPYGVCCHCGKISHLGKKLLFLDCLIVCCINWTFRTHRRGTSELCQTEKGRVAPQGSCFTEENSRKFAGHKGK